MAILPFDIEKLLPNQFIELGSLKIPKYGSLTPREHEDLKAIDDNLPYPLFQAEFCKVLVCSRVGGIPKDIDLTTVPIHLLNEVYEFGMNEARQWVSQSEEPEVEESEKKEDLIESSLNSDSNTPT